MTAAAEKIRARWRAVCRVHGPAPRHWSWLADETHDAWIFAKIDAVAHNLAEHPVQNVVVPADLQDDGLNQLLTPL